MKNTFARVIEGSNPGFRYGSELSILTERLSAGRLIFSDMRCSGVPQAEKNEPGEASAFDLIIDGVSLYYGWSKRSFDVERAENGVETASLTLDNGSIPVSLRIITRCCGYGFFSRTLEISNNGVTNLGITSVTPLSGTMFELGGNLNDFLDGGTYRPYSLGYFQSVEAHGEGDFAWTDIPYNAALGFGSRRGRSGCGHPFFIARNNLFGGYFFCQLGWTGNWRAETGCEIGKKKSHISDCARLRFSIGPSSPSPARIIAPGETVATPTVHFGMSADNFEALVQSLHRYQREQVLTIGKNGVQPVIVNHWGYMEHEMSTESLMAEIDLAHLAGGEVFMVDAGWFGSRGTRWFDTVGDWSAKDRLPDDLFGVFGYARSKGMGVGLWVEIESAGKSSSLAEKHPDWFISRYGSPVPRILDLAKPEVREYAKSELMRIIERYSLDMLRIDYNSDPMEGGFNDIGGAPENSLWRHMQSLWDILDEIRAKYPSLMMENCSGGGGRTDPGIVGRFTTTWISDYTKLPRTVKMLNGMSIVLPPEFLNRLFGVCLNSADQGSLDAQMQAVIMAHPCLSGYAPSAEELNHAALAVIRKYIDIYKSFIRPMHADMRVHHHQQSLAGCDGLEWSVLEYSSQSCGRVAATVFRQPKTDCGVYTLRFKSLSPDSLYTVRELPTERTFDACGLSLSREGLRVALDQPLTSRMYLLTELRKMK